jgi:hypothetical protein
VCAQGRRATRLRYAPTVTALFILKHFPTLLLVRPVLFTPTVHELCTHEVLAPRLCTLAPPSISGNGCHFVGSTIELYQCFALHLQLHLRILLEDLPVAPAEHLGHPFIAYASGTQPVWH